MNSLIFKLRYFIYKLLYLFDLATGRKNKLFILCYHSVGKNSYRFGVNLGSLKKQVEYLVKNFTPVSMDDVADHIKGKKIITRPSFAITFDDGYEDVYKTKEFFRKLNIKPTLFLLSGIEEPERGQLNNSLPFIKDKEILSLKRVGWILGSHGNTHGDFNSLGLGSLNSEIIESKRVLEKRLKTKIKYFAYPKGVYSSEIMNLVKKAGYTLGLSMDDGVIELGINNYVVPRIGIDRSHTFAEFKATFSPSVVLFRKDIKDSLRFVRNCLIGIDLFISSLRDTFRKLRHIITYYQAKTWSNI